MAHRKTRHFSHALPGAPALRRSFLVLLVASALMLLMMGRNEHPGVMKLRASILDAVTPVITAAASPFDAVADAGAWIAGFLNTRAENVALRNRNLELLQFQAAAQRMEAENASLKALLNVVPSKKTAYVSARMVSDLSGPFAQAGLLNGGSLHGIARDQAVVNEHGLIGRVVEAGETSARVLLLTDINSRVPVMGEQSRVKSMLVGNNSRLPTLAYLPKDNGIAPGERIVTSGDGGIFPAGIPVGVVNGIEDGAFSVRLLADITRIEYVSAVDFSFK